MFGKKLHVAQDGLELSVLPMTLNYWSSCFYVTSTENRDLPPHLVYAGLGM